MKRSWDVVQHDSWGDDFPPRRREDGMDDMDGEEDEEKEDWGQPSKVACPIISPARQSGLGNETCLVSKLGHSRTIIHIDLDCFYAQVEMLRNPALRDKPLGIQQKNIVVTTNYVARARGVSKLSYIKDAVVKCPDLVLVSGEDLSNYRETSAKITELLEEFCPLVERLGFDENFMDVTKLVEMRISSNSNKTSAPIGHSYGEGDKMSSEIAKCTCGCRARLTLGSHIAKEMREALKSRLGLTSCAGIATNKLLAKLVGGHHKPNDQTVLYPEWAGHFIQTFTKVRQIPGIGHASGKKLAANGISTLQELRETPVSKLSALFGSQQAEMMMRLAHGVDDTPVVSKGPPQSLSDEDSFKKLGTVQAAKETMRGLLKNLLTRLKADGRTPHTMRVTVRKFAPGTWHRESRQTTIPVAIFSKQDEESILSRLLDVAVDLLQKLVNTNQPFHLTLINICFTNLRSKVTKGSMDAFLGKATSVKSQPSRTVLSDGNQQSLSRNAPGSVDCLDDQNVDNIGVHDPCSNQNSNKKSFSCQDKSVLKRDDRHPPSTFTTISENSSKIHGKQKGNSSHSSFFKKLAASSSPSKTKASGESEVRMTAPHAVSTKTEQAGELTTYQHRENAEDVEDCIHMDGTRYHATLGFSQRQSTHVENVEEPSTAKLTGMGVEQNELTCITCKVPDNDGRSSTAQTQEGQELDENGVEMPPDVDRSVFDALPSNMRDELIAEWKRSKKRKEEESHRQSTPKPLRRTLKSSSSKKKQQPPASGNTIMKYLKH